MDLFSMTRGLVGSVNPEVNVTIKRSKAGYAYSTKGDGSREPLYDTVPDQMMQVEELSSGELQHMNNLNITGIMKKVYYHGALTSADRSTGKGGDILVIGGETFLVVNILEQWPTWTAAIAKKQAQVTA